MASKNKTRYAILGILSIHSGTGYDIKKYCDTVISNFWNENFGHIYPVLNQLLEDGWIQTDESSSPRKKVYSITETGRLEFLKWLAEPAGYQPERSEFLLKFTFSSNLDKKAILRMLSDYRKMHCDRLDKYQLMQKDLQKGLKDVVPERELFLYAPLRLGILNTRAAIDWCDEIMMALEKSN
ncbi:PadR family transcriptional regulator [Anaerocolumna jejuensis]|uniref:PadR family transcriptional regulator n=1 Tax=Anaerocolumna jejuensis TaxID=259063 RepID=UPI003F7BFC61